MPYIGRDLNRGNYLKLDDISSSFNSSTKTFNLTVGGSAFKPGSAFSILVSVGGVIQEPEAAYQVNNSEITFASAPTAQDSFFCIALGVALGVGVPGNGTVNGAQIAKPFNYDGYFYLDDTNNRVGIGSLAPTVELDVSGKIKASSFSGPIGNPSGISTFYDLRVTNNLTVEGTTTTLDTNLIGVDRVEVGATSDTIVGVAITQTGSADILNIFNASGEQVTVLSSGNVGIGSAAPELDLDVARASSGDNVVKVQNRGSALSLIKYPNVNNPDVRAGSDYGHFAVYTGGDSGSRKLKVEHGGDVKVENGFFAVTDPSEKIGIGLANPVKPLHIYTAGIDSEIRLQTNSGTEQNSYISLRHATGDLDLFTVQAGTKMKFFTANTERLQITGTGQFHMGGTPGWTYASQKFVVVEPSNPLGMTLQGNNANQGVNLTLQNISNTVNAYSDISFADDGGQIFGAIRGKVVDRDNNHGEIQFHTSSGSLGQQVTIDKDGNVIIGTSTWQYKKPLNVQGESGSILSLYNGDTTSYAANTYSAIELKILTGNTGNTFGALEIRGIKEEGTNGNNARALTFYTGVNGGTNQERLRITSDGMLKIERGSASDTAL